MDFQDSSRDRRGYHRLEINGENTRRQVWTKKVRGRVVKGVKLSRARKLNWKPFSIVFVLSRRIARFYGGFVKRMKMDEACPAIVFSYQWGIPVLSHSSSVSRCSRSLTWL